MRYLILILPLLFISCSKTSNPTTPLSTYNSKINSLSKLCNEGLGNGTYCLSLAKKYEIPPIGISPNIFRSQISYQHAIYALTRECNEKNSYSCVKLSLLYKEGKGGLVKDIKQAYKYYTDGCSGSKVHHSCYKDKKFYFEYKRSLEKTKEIKRIRKDPCSLIGLNLMAAQVECKMYKNSGYKINFSSCIDSVLRRALKKQGCKKSPI